MKGQGGGVFGVVAGVDVDIVAPAFDGEIPGMGSGGTGIGSSDKDGAYPAHSPQKPENMAATIYHAMGIPATAAWYDQGSRPHHIYHGDPIYELLG